MRGLRATRLIGGVVAHRQREQWCCQQLHRHAGQLRGFGAGAALPDQFLMRRKIGVKAVPRFMHQCRDIVGHADRVHEDERLLAMMQRGAIATGRLVLTTFEIEQPVTRHIGEA